MTSTWATNYVSQKLDREYYLQCTKEGHPLQRQVPQTYQNYTGVGAESIALDGSDRLIIDSDLASGPLIINALDNQNLHGRVIYIVLVQTTQSAITLNYDGEIHVPGSETTTNVMVFPAGQTPTTFILDFYGLEDMMISESNTVPGPPIHLPAILNFPILQDVTNIIDPSSAARLAFNPADTDSRNTTTITYDVALKVFTVATAGEYSIFFTPSLRGNLDRCVRIVIGIDTGGVFTGRTWGVTSAGLTNQNLSLSWGGYLNAGDQIAITSQYEPTLGVPGTGYNLMNGSNTQTITAKSFIQIQQL